MKSGTSRQNLNSKDTALKNIFKNTKDHVKKSVTHRHNLSCDDLSAILCGGGGLPLYTPLHLSLRYLSCPFNIGFVGRCRRTHTKESCIHRPDRLSVKDNFQIVQNDTSRSFVMFQKAAHLFQLILDSVHLLVVLAPKLASLERLTLSHLSGADDLIHEVAEQPHTNEAQGYDQDQHGSQFWNPEEDLQLVACCDDEKGEVDDNEKGLSQIETVFLCEE